MPAACTTPHPQPKHAKRCVFHCCCEMPADDVTSGGMPPMISGQTIIGMGGHKRQQRRQQQEQLSLSLLPPRSKYSTSHSSLCHRDTPCTSWLRQHILLPAAPQKMPHSVH
ncbi:hypothetical protein TcCL_Unassigned00236 [Trypanosoma cruzi]|nr:hypothetical protein TcCL_Unassigned00236 [Trypanosoma cruzi]